MLTLRRVSAEEIDMLRNHPDELVPLFQDVDGVDGLAQQMDQRAMESAISAIDNEAWIRYATSNSSTGIESIAASMVEHLRQNSPPTMSRPEYLDLDKSWHILHTVISGSPEPSDAPEAALLGGEDVGADHGYGPARLLDPDSVAAFSEVLASIDVETLKARANPAELREQGVAFVQSEFDLGMVELEVEDHFPKLVQFVSQTVKKKQGLLLFLN